MNEKILRRGLRTYNKYRSPIATAKLLEVKGDRFKVQFKGSFCRTCGMDEYFLDLVYELESENLETELERIRPIREEKFIAEYKVIS